MANINIYVAESDVALDLDAGDALGFFGDDGFGDTIDLNSYNGRTFITDVNGIAEKYECDNCKLTVGGSWSGVSGVSGVIIGQTGNGIALRRLPNYLATINIRFTHPEEVLIQNANLIAYDGSNIENKPTGLRVFGAEIIHTDRIQTNTGAGDESWIEMQGSGLPVGLVDSPGTSGESPFGPATLDTRHDWYVALSISPTTPNDKTFKFRVELEYI